MESNTITTQALLTDVEQEITETLAETAARIEELRAEAQQYREALAAGALGGCRFRP